MLDTHMISNFEIAHTFHMKYINKSYKTPYECARPALLVPRASLCLLEKQRKRGLKGGGVERQ